MTPFLKILPTSKRMEASEAAPFSAFDESLCSLRSLLELSMGLISVRQWSIPFGKEIIRRGEPYGAVSAASQRTMSAQGGPTRSSIGEVEVGR